MPRQTIDINLATGIDSKAEDKFVGPDKVVVSENAVIERTGEVRKRTGFLTTENKNISGNDGLFARDGNTYRASEKTTTSARILSRSQSSAWEFPEERRLYSAKLLDYRLIPQLNDDDVIVAAAVNGKLLALMNADDDPTIYVYDIDSFVQLYKTVCTGSIVNGDVYISNMYPYEDGFFVVQSGNSGGNVVTHGGLWRPTTGSSLSLTWKPFAIGTVSAGVTVLDKKMVISVGTGSIYTHRATSATPLANSTHGITIAANHIPQPTVQYIPVEQQPAAGYDALVTFSDEAAGMYSIAINSETGAIYTSSLPLYSASNTDDGVDEAFPTALGPQYGNRVIGTQADLRCSSLTSATASVGQEAMVATEMRWSTLPVAYKESVYFVTRNTSSTSPFLTLWANNGAYITPVLDFGIRDTRHACAYSVTIPSDNPNLTQDIMGTMAIQGSVLHIAKGSIYAKIDLDHIASKSVDTGEFSILAADKLYVLSNDFDQLGIGGPPVIASAAVASGGSVDDGVHGYQAYVQYTDIYGNVSRSEVSPVVTATTSGGNNTVNLTIRIPGNIYTSGQKYAADQSKLLIYRTAANGSIYYLRDTQNIDLYDTSPTASFTLSDTAADSTITANANIYTTGGVLENSMTPPVRSIVSRRDKLFLVSKEDPYNVWTSKPIETNVEPEFNDSLKVYIPDEGEIICLGVLDRYIIAFKEGSIYAFTGDGPNAIGIGSFSPVQKLASDVGCINELSVTTTSQGIMFQSDRGIELLDRGLSVQYIGAPVYEYRNDTIVNTSVVKDRNHIRFDLNSGKALIYDLYHNTWHVHTYVDGTKAAIVHKNHTTRINTRGKVCIEDTSLYTDDGESYIMAVETAWLRLTGKQDYQRVQKAYILGDFLSTSTLSVKIYYDYSTVPEQIFTVSAADFALSSGEVHQLEFRPARQKCQAIRFRIEDNAADGAGIALNTLSLVLEDIPETSARTADGRKR